MLSEPSNWDVCCNVMGYVTREIVNVGITEMYYVFSCVFIQLVKYYCLAVKHVMEGFN